MTSPVGLGARTTTEVAGDAARRILLVPVGSTEQHGPHLPLDTDTRIAVELARRAAAASDRFVVGPAIAYGASGEHAGFAGTVSIGTDVLTSVLVEVGRSADAFAGVVFVNGHGGNAEALRSAVGLLRGEGRAVRAWSWALPGADAHAGRTETSLLLAIAPATVRLERAVPGRTEPIDELFDALRAHGVVGVSPNGVLGDPTGASAVEGEALLERLVGDLVEFLGRRPRPGPHAPSGQPDGLGNGTTGS